MAYEPVRGGSPRDAPPRNTTTQLAPAATRPRPASTGPSGEPWTTPGATRATHQCPDAEATTANARPTHHRPTRSSPAPKPLADPALRPDHAAPPNGANRSTDRHRRKARHQGSRPPSKAPQPPPRHRQRRLYCRHRRGPDRPSSAPRRRRVHRRSRRRRERPRRRTSTRRPGSRPSTLAPRSPSTSARTGPHHRHRHGGRSTRGQPRTHTGTPILALGWSGHARPHHERRRRPDRRTGPDQDHDVPSDPPRGAELRGAADLVGNPRHRHQGHRPDVPLHQGRQGRPVRRRRRGQDRDHAGTDQQHRQGLRRLFGSGRRG